MDQQTFQRELTELMGQFAPATIRQVQMSAQEPDEPPSAYPALHQSVRDLQESLDHLRLTVKYLLFDLEATRRENKYLRQMLEEQTLQDGECDGGPV